MRLSGRRFPRAVVDAVCENACALLARRAVRGHVDSCGSSFRQACKKRKSAQGAPYFLVDLKQNTSREGRFGFRWACVRSCRCERRANCGSSFCQARKMKTGGCCLPSHFGGPAQNRTAVLQGSSADPTRLVGDRSRARKVHRRPFRTHASENRSAAGEVSRRKEFPTRLTPRFRPWADERRRSLKG